MSPNLKLTVDMDKLLVDFVLEKLKQNKLCSMNDIRKQTMYIYQNCNIKQKLGNFKASLAWCKRWMKRHHLSYLRVSNRKTGQKKKKPEENVKEKTSYQRQVKIAERQYGKDRVNLPLVLYI